MIISVIGSSKMLYAQYHYVDEQNVQLYHRHIPLSENEISHFLKTHFYQTIPNVYLLKDTVLHSPYTSHYHYLITLDSIPVYRGKIIAEFHQNTLTRFALPDFNLLCIDKQFPDKNKIYLQIKDTIQQNARIKLTRCYFPTEKGLQPAVRVEIATADRLMHYEKIIDNQYYTIYENDLRSFYYSATKDTLIRATIFNPDPLTSAKTTYGGAYIDNYDNDVYELNNEIDTVYMYVSYDEQLGKFQLSGKYVKITDLSSPSVPAVEQSNPDFLFTRSQSAFEDVNAYYHIDKFQNYIQSLGFTNLMSDTIMVDTHANNGADNSYFSYASFPQLHFGEGGVDDAEDADVIIHEYAHAISYSANQSNFGTERQSLDEAVGDFLAVSYSKSIDDYQYTDVFSWDGHNEFWNGRTTVSSKHYPENYTGSIYQDAEIFSATLVEIESTLGRDVIHQILFQSLYNYTANLSMPQAAELLLSADSLIFNAQHDTLIKIPLCRRGLLDSLQYCQNLEYKPIPADTSAPQDDNLILTEPSDTILNVKVYNYEKFSTSEEDLIIEVPAKQTMQLALIDIKGGTVVYNYPLNYGVHTLSPKHLHKGVYILKIYDINQVYFTGKILKIHD